MKRSLEKTFLEQDDLLHGHTLRHSALQSTLPGPTHLFATLFLRVTATGAGM